MRYTQQYTPSKIVSFFSKIGRKRIAGSFYSWDAYSLLEWEMFNSSPHCPILALVFLNFLAFAPMQFCSVTRVDVARIVIPESELYHEPVLLIRAWNRIVFFSNVNWSTELLINHGDNGYSVSQLWFRDKSALNWKSLQF